MADSTIISMTCPLPPALITSIRRRLHISIRAGPMRSLIFSLIVLVFEFLPCSFPPWVKRRHVCSTVFDHTSILRYVSDKWLRPASEENPSYLTRRVATTNSIAACLSGGPGHEELPPKIDLQPLAEPQDLAERANTPLSDHQEALVAFSETLPETPGEDFIESDDVQEQKRREHLDLSQNPLAQWALATARVQAFLRRNN
jgi:hypothetical protein